MNPRLSMLWKGLAALALAYVVLVIGVWDWMVCRVEVPAGSSLRLSYKGPFPFGGVPQAEQGTLVQLDKHGRPEKIGILEAMPGPGRHFYSPMEYERVLVPDVVIKPNEVGIVTSKVGKSLPQGAILADGPGFRGTWRRVLTPGRYRMNTYAYTVEPVPANKCIGSAVGVRARPEDPTLIPPGYVGVVTNNADNPLTGETQGIQEAVLQPGIYYINPHEKKVDVISIGYNETTAMVQAVDERGSPAGADKLGDRLGKFGISDPTFVPGKGIEFKSNDGFPIHMDYTAIWGILPDQAPDVVRQFGALTDVEEKVVIPQIGSICQTFGSKRGAVDLLVGDKREEFQTDTAGELERVLTSKNLTLLFGLTRHIYVPAQVREPIQKKNIADELTKTREQEQLTAKAQADLTEAKAKVILEERRTKAETNKLVAEVAATGEKKARLIGAETEKLRTEIDAETAVIRARITTTMGEAEARKVELLNQAEADRYRQYVDALGGPEAYNRYVFADKLPADLRVGIFYAGPGTFWTDLKGFEQVLLGKAASEADWSGSRAKKPEMPSGGN